MNTNKKKISGLVLFTIAMVIHFYSYSKLRVEQGYSGQFFPAFGRALRSFSGKIPFSVGDLLYGILFLWLAWLLVKLLRFFASKRQRRQWKEQLTGTAWNVFIVLCSVYIIFNIFWGINYNRKGIAWQLGLKEEKYSIEDIKLLNCLLIDKVNASKKQLMEAKRNYPQNKQLFSMVEDAYANIAKTYPFLNYGPASIKPGIWKNIQSYTGITGYYNPFTGEAQLNTQVPKFVQPYTACHEVAHQLGYAKEMEANFVGYLAAAASTDTLLHYSVYFDLFLYANRNLFFADSATAKLYRKELLPQVVDDIKEWRDFNLKHQSFLEPIVRFVYGHFLRRNEQPQGLQSYDEVTGFLIAYYKKFGKL
ncbi:MAG: DUF3810 domain-containing protein [Ferruginibacter sp.]